MTNATPIRAATTTTHALATCAALVLTACGSDVATSGGQAGAGANADASAQADAGADVQGVANPTWHRDIRPMLQAKCVGCHQAGGIAPFALESLDDARAMGFAMVGAVDSGRMPPWGAQDTTLCQPPMAWKHDLRLSPVQRATLRGWVQAGGPEGDAKDAPAAVAAPPDKLDRVDRSLVSKVGHTVSGKADQFICFVLDPKLDADAWVDGVHFRAGDARVAHHALLFADDAAKSVALGGGDGVYPCFGGPGVDARLLAAWAPGGVPTELPPGAGLPLAKGSRLVLQMHYHPIETPVPDATTVELRLAKSKPIWTALSMLIGNFPGPLGGGDGLLPGPNDKGKTAFHIPAGAKDHSETMVWTVPKFGGIAIGGLRVFGVASHMHYAGTDMRIALERGSVAGACGDGAHQALAPCLATKCAGKVANDLVACAVVACNAAVQQAPQPCQQCLVAASGAGQKEMWSVCAPQKVEPLSGETCLLHTPSWDFAWQRYYFFDAPPDELPAVRSGDRLWLHCKFDNSLSNPAVAGALASQGKQAPGDVWLGEATLDEMCLAAIVLLYPTPPAQ